MDGGQTRRVGLSRLLVLCALLFGLFSMHGAPASAATGCHGDLAPATPMGAPMSMGHTDMWGGHMAAHAATVASRAHAATVASRAYAATVAPPTGGELCVSTPARDRLPAAAAGLFALLGLVVLLVWGLAGRPATALMAARRGPPFNGRGLLLQVCIART
ncbi:hypothetical protein [Streptomyces sp. MBT27]|uniref:hypothetical protein n=1 Tax=Streptomyces sp. MBT27 TaxID=1488356 RepID=UPI00142490A7|nr:hypothetical protein [Streptomyces sp. MBT27]